ncbi:MAG: hypothetical protein F4029_02490 [Gammaproteobacteria bacterium]|nr:hypothetical protein [Gammaproteobacteria bacterium]MXY58425.1 hypothetical protein [Gammaproteobacteria bacterium]MYF29497.1 hypothetical protein [Gammaproteobacteria bacterium]MYK45078.1 hypothetical protein [Gammaproteobacteria bacterium]
MRRRHAFHGCLGVGSLLVVALVSFGCTTLQSTQLPPEELRYGIRSGDLVQPGDEISVVTVDGAELVLVARDVDDAVIRGELPGGEEATVAIDDLVALRTHQVDPVRTGFAVAGGSYALTLLLWVFIGFTIVFGAA